MSGLVHIQLVFLHASVALDASVRPLYNLRSNMQDFCTSSISLSHNPWPTMPTNLLCYTQVLVNYTQISQHYWPWTEESAGLWQRSITPPALNKQLIGLLPPLFWRKTLCCRVTVLTFDPGSPLDSLQLITEVLTGREDGSVNNRLCTFMKHLQCWIMCTSYDVLVLSHRKEKS